MTRGFERSISRPDQIPHLTQALPSGKRYIDVRWDWDVERAMAANHAEFPTVDASVDIHQAQARSILRRQWNNNEQTSRSTPKWKDKERYNIDSLDTINCGDLRGFIVSTLDAEVYTPYVTPGLHAVPKDFASADCLLINNYSWGTKKDERVLWDKRGVVQKRQLVPVQKWEAQISMYREKDGYKFRGITRENEEGERFYLSRDFLTHTNEKYRIENVDWKKEIIDECSRRLFEETFKHTSELEEVWLCEGDIAIEKEMVLEDRTVFQLAFYYIDVEQPSAAAIRSWKIGEQRREIERAKLQRQAKLRKKWQTVHIGRTRPRFIDTPAESKALKTLRDLVSEMEYRRYLTNGFIMVKGKSGLFYQVFSDQRNIQVWRNNEKQFNICIHTDRSCPPTDHVINCKYLIEFDEKEVWRGGNVAGKGLGELGRISHSQNHLIEENWNMIVGNMENKIVLCS